MITVVPETFEKVFFEAKRVAELASEALKLIVDLPDDTDVRVDVAEEYPTSRTSVTSIEPIVLTVDGGALENYKDPRELGELESRITFTRMLLEVVDRRSATFGAPDLDAELSQAHRAAWDVNLFGRTGRLGLRLHRPRFLYDFRNRHGFTDLADQVFDELWAADHLTWDEIVARSDKALAVKP